MKAVIYPYKPQYEYLINAMKYFRADLTITAVVTPEMYFNSSSVPNNIHKYSKLEDAFVDTECVIFLPMDNIDLLYKKITVALGAKKKIILGVTLPLKMLNCIIETATKSGVPLEYQEHLPLIEFLRRRADLYTQQESIVIAVGTLTQGINSNQAVIGLGIELLSQGYRVEIIADNSELSVLNIKQLPIDEMIDRDLDYTIMQINRYMNLFQLKNRPDIIILQLPNEGFFRISSDYSTCFGARTYLISQAVAIDYCVMITPYMSMDTELFSELSDISEKRYGFKYDSICIESKTVDMQGTAGETKLRYYLTQEEVVKETVLRLQEEDKSERLYFCYSSEWYKQVANDIIMQLS